MSVRRRTKKARAMRQRQLQRARLILLASTFDKLIRESGVKILPNLSTMIRGELKSSPAKVFEFGFVCRCRPSKGPGGS